MRRPPPTLRNLTLDVVVPDKDAKSCMRSRETPIKREKTTSRFLPSQTPLWIAGFVMRSPPDVYSTVVRFSNGEYNNVCYITSILMRRKS